jgi:hypothetical protein
MNKTTQTEMPDGITIFSTSLGLDLIYRKNGVQQRKLHLPKQSQAIKLKGVAFQLIINPEERKLQARMSNGDLLTFMSYQNNSRFFTYLEPLQRSEPEALF